MREQHASAAHAMNLHVKLYDNAISYRGSLAGGWLSTALNSPSATSPPGSQVRRKRCPPAQHGRFHLSRTALVHEHQRDVALRRELGQADTPHRP
ncbi:uncharacterized protein PHACADRAFT_253606 [Phanerochaete carnosa HHB-10118-sp]|uniref:Uncharacterized protein n=1 Tax=Phanerochaete carnosa (strain HHB-10118-sp) TaxID=650164 RepID=K5VY18_PHACS|nr:uncharacterized protein PHACADRAFT_253606 [Phanerochaete carnosa HHB-10118-sp]EKM56468.1 hypothetical protein PHACADRAFT_253606 [Phanerochaete carnosa HHB-10118-sp]